MRQQRRGFARWWPLVLTSFVAAPMLAACASFGDLTGPKAIPLVVASVEVPVQQPMLGVGATIALQAMVRDAGGRAVEDRPVSWSTSDTAIARVSTAGVVTGVSVGRVQIAASVDGRSAVATLIVTPRAVASVVVQPGNPRVFIGGQLQLFSTMLGESGDTLSGRNVLWTSSDPRIATVDNFGLLTGLTVGVTTVTATSENRSAAVGVTVSAVPVNSVQITPSVDNVVVGQTTSLTAVPRDSIGGALTDRSVVWLSSDPAIATVSSSGTVLGIKAGSVTISATADDKTGTARIVVQARPVSAIIVSPSQAALAVAQTVKLSVLVTDDNGTLLTGRPVQFASANTAVAQVAADGTVTARAPGSTTITVTSEGKTGVASITVAASAVASVRVEPATVNLVTGGTIKLSASALDASGNVLTQRAVTWTSGSPTVASVTADGSVTGVSAGTALVFATIEGKLASATISVRALVVSAVIVTPTSSVVNVGDALDLTAEVRDAGGTVISGRSIVWTSSDERIAVVSSTGRVRVLASGPALITATVDGVVGSAAITASAESVLTVTVEPTAIGLSPGATATLVPTARGRNGVALAGRTFTFASSDATVATVSASGVVTAIKTGTATITVTSEGKTAPVVVTVSPAPVATVQISLAEPARTVGQTTQATSIAKDAGGNVLVGRTVAWTTSNANVATISASGVVTAVAPGTATITATVEGKTASATVTVSVVPVASVSVVLAQPTRFVGQSTQATAMTRDASNGVLNGRAVSWSSSNTSVATVSLTGTVSAVGVGTANIIATSEGQSGFAVLTVTLAPVASVAVTADNTTRYIGQTTQVSASLRDAQGNPLTGRSVVWSSSNTAVATVSSTGLVRAVGVGNADITATSDGVTGSVTVTVTPIPVETVEVSIAQSKIAVGKNTQASAVTRDPNNNILTGRIISWTSSNAAIAFVSSAGVVTGLRAGTATITATSEGKSGSATLTVVILPVGTVTVALTPSSLLIGQTSQATVTTVDTSGTVVVGRAISWSSSTPSVATVSASGVVTAVGAGTATITAISEGVTGSQQVVVGLVPVATVSLTVASTTIVANGTTTSTVVLRDASNNILSGRAVQFSSSNGAVASVSPAGVITGLSEGATSITATSEGKSASIALTVTPAPVATVTVTLPAANSFVGRTFQATVTLRDASNRVLNNREITWSSSNTNVATVSSTGVVSTVGVGTTNIIATSETKTGSASLTVTLAPVASITVTLASSAIATFQTTQATAVLKDADGFVLTGRPLTWTTQNGAVAQVSPTGVVTGLLPGTTDVTATSGTVSGSATLEISNASVASVSVSLGAGLLAQGQTTQASATTRDAGNNVLTGRAIAWSSSNTAVATVTSSGLVATIGPGSANIIATSEGKTGSASLTVIAVPVASVSVTLSSSSVTVGGTTQATAVTRDADNTVLPGRSISWSSSNSAVATVNASGLVTTLSAGTTNIIATSEGKSGTAALTVVPVFVPVASVSVVLLPATVSVGQTSRATASTRDANNNVLSGRAVSWSSSNTNVATVSATGLVTTFAAGTANIVATSESQSGSATLTVTVVPVASIDVALASNSLTAGSTTQATATPRDANNNALTGRVITWSSSNVNVAEVSSSGVVTAVRVGTVNIIATSESKTGSASLTVTAVPVATVSVSLASVLINTNQTTQATASTFDGSGAQLTGRTITWSSSNTNVAVVNSSGLVTAVSVGNATIIATSEGKTGSAALTVAAVPIATIDVSLASSALSVNGTTQATATPRDANNNPLSGRTVNWSSSNTSVAVVDAAGLVRAVATGTANIIATSEGKSGSAPLSVSAAPVASVTVSLASSSITTSQTTQATASTFDASSAPLAGRVITWSSSNAAVATVSATGVVTPTGVGTANIIATSEGKAGSAPLTVTVVPVATVDVALASGTLTVNATTQATATPRDANNIALPGRAVVWSSSNTNVATVSAAGVVTAVGVGSANILATSETKTGSASLTVTAVPVASVTVSLGSSSINTSQTTQATASTLDAAGNPLSGRSITWSTSNAAVATVSVTGLVTPVAAGTANIIAVSEGKTGSAALTVTAVPVATVTVSLAASALVVNGTTQATATPRDANNNALTGRAVTWTSSNTNVAVVSVTGVVTAVAPGSANIIATSETKTGSAALTVTATPVASVTVALAASSINTSQTTQATATTADASGTQLNGRSVSWSTSNSAVATVSVTGQVTPVGAGTVNIIATSEGQTGSSQLVVTTVPVNSVEVTLAQPTLAVNATTQATAVLRDANNNVLSGRTITWSSSDAAVASVNATTGVVKANQTGSANITATSEGQSGFATVTVP